MEEEEEEEEGAGYQRGGNGPRHFIRKGARVMGGLVEEEEGEGEGEEMGEGVVGMEREIGHHCHQGLVRVGSRGGRGRGRGGGGFVFNLMEKKGRNRNVRGEGGREGGRRRWKEEKAN